MSERTDNGYKLVLEIEVPGFYVDGETQAQADKWADGDLLTIVTEEWMRADVGLTLVSLPGEKCMNDDFEVHAMNGRIVGARITSATGDRTAVANPTPLPPLGEQRDGPGLGFDYPNRDDERVGPETSAGAHSSVAQEDQS